MQPGLLATAIAALSLSYLLFVFISESTNPFVKPLFKRQLRRRWVLGRSISMIFLLTAFVAMAMGSLFQFTTAFQLVFVFGVTALLCIVPVWNYLELFKRSSESQNVSEDLSNTKQTTPANNPNIQSQVAPPLPSVDTVDRAATTQSTNVPAVAISADSNVEVTSQQISPHLLGLEQTVSNNETEDEPEITTSAERQLEMELATAHINPDLTDLDQSIAEAEFFVEDINNGSDFSVARPSSETQQELKHAVADEAEPASKVADQAVADENTDDATSELISQLVAQEREIAALQSNNRKLNDIRDTLQVEVETLKQTARASNVNTRKMTAQLKHAIEIKNKALALATMEQKKRKLIEIRAIKTIAKLKQHSIEAKAALENSQ